MSARLQPADLPTVKVSTRFELDAGPARHRIGLIALDSDVATERDFHAMLPPDVMFYTSRIHCTNPVTVENLRRQGPLLREAVKLLIPDQRLDAIAYSCNSGTVAIGYEGVASEIRAAGRPGIPVVTPITSAIAGFAHLGIRRISLLTPYLDSVNQAMRAFLESHGVEVVNIGGFCMEDDREMARIPPGALLDAALEVCDERADALHLVHRAPGGRDHRARGGGTWPAGAERDSDPALAVAARSGIFRPRAGIRPRARELAARRGETLALRPDPGTEPVHFRHHPHVRSASDDLDRVAHLGAEGYPPPVDGLHRHRDLHTVPDGGGAEVVHLDVDAERRLARVEMFVDEPPARILHVVDHRRCAVYPQFIAEEVDGVGLVDGGVLDPSNPCDERFLHFTFSVVITSFPMKSFATKSAWARAMSSSG